MYMTLFSGINISPFQICHPFMDHLCLEIVTPLVNAEFASCCGHINLSGEETLLPDLNSLSEKQTANVS